MKQALLFATLLAGCAIAHAEPTSSEARKPGEFHAINITGTIGVDARIGPTTSVEVRGTTDRLKQVSTDVKNGVLVIGTKGELKNSHLRVIITAPSLDALTVSGTGELTVKGITSPRLDVSVPGTGQVTVAGTTTDLHLSIGGTGGVKAKELIAATASVTIAGTGQTVVHASRALDVTVSGTGAVEVYGKPEHVKKSISGTGAVSLH